MKTADQRRMKLIIQNFKNQRPLVLGDLMLDKYIWGNVSRISPEAPVPVVEVQKDSFCLGGAGNVYENLKSLGATPLLIGAVGRDEEGRWIAGHISDGRGLFKDPHRPTTVKTRIIAHHQQVVRVDFEKRSGIPENIQIKILDLIRRQGRGGLVLSDYNKGLLSEKLLAGILPFAEKKRIMVFVDPKADNFPFYSPVTLITPNHVEAEKIVGHECRTVSQVERAGKEILSRVRSRYLILKRGEEGMSVFAAGRKPVHIPTVAREVFDVTGAGDTVIATAALALLAGADIFEAARLANAAAGVVVGKIGTASVTPGELLAALDRD